MLTFNHLRRYDVLWYRHNLLHLCTDLVRLRHMHVHLIPIKISIVWGRHRQVQSKGGVRKDAHSVTLRQEGDYRLDKCNIITGCCCLSVAMNDVIDTCYMFGRYQASTAYPAIVKTVFMSKTSPSVSNQSLTIMDILCKEGCRLKMTTSPLMR